MSPLETPGALYAFSCNVVYFCTLEAPLFLIAFLKDVTKRQTLGAFWSDLFEWNSWSWTDHLPSYIWSNPYCWCKRTLKAIMGNFNLSYVQPFEPWVHHYCYLWVFAVLMHEGSGTWLRILLWQFSQDERLVGFLLLFLYYGEIKFTCGIPFLPVCFYVGFRIPGFKSDSKNSLFFLLYFYYLLGKGGYVFGSVG